MHPGSEENSSISYTFAELQAHTLVRAASGGSFITMSPKEHYKQVKEDVQLILTLASSIVGERVLKEIAKGEKES